MGHGDPMPRLMGQGHTRAMGREEANRESVRAAGPGNAGTEPIRLVLADRQPVVLEGLESVFGRDGACRVVATATTPEDAVRMARKHEPDVIVLDAHLAGPGEAPYAGLRTAAPKSRIVLFAADLSPAEARRALRSGVRGILMKHVRTGLAVECVRKVAAGGRWLERHSTGRMIDTMVHQDAAAGRLREVLTDREAQIAALATAGHRNSEIARRLRITAGTVKVHLHNIYRKLGVSGRVQLILWAQSNDLQ